MPLVTSINTEVLTFSALMHSFRDAFEELLCNTVDLLGGGLILWGMLLSYPDLGNAAV